jgi:hypothetical protein
MTTKRGQHPKSRANLRPFPKGVCPNPGGRPKGFVGRIKEACGEDYEKLVEGFCLLAFGTPAERRAFFGESVKVSARDRLMAMVELRDSGPGRPVQTVDVGDGSPPPDWPVFIFPPGTHIDVQQ